MEINIGDYGKMMFEMMISRDVSDLPEHWASIRKEAEPLVRELLALNEKMVVDDKQGGYKIHGYKTKKGKKKLSELERITLAQKKLWGCKAGTLKDGDHIWVNDYESEHEMYIGEQDPAPVQDVTKKGIYVEMQGCNYEYIILLQKDADVLKAPTDWDEDSEVYASREYWLLQADKLGI